jgi:hypothetical protein
MVERERLGKPEEEAAASSSSQSAAGLGGGTPEGHPAPGRDMEGEERGRDGVGYDGGTRRQPIADEEEVEREEPPSGDGRSRRREI